MAEEPNKDDDLENREEKRKYLADWLDNFRDASEIAPLVSNELEKTEWEKSVLINRPDISDEVYPAEMSTYLIFDLENTKRVLPMLPNIDRKTISLDITSTSASATVSVFSYAAHIGDLPDEGAKQFSYDQQAAYQNMIIKQNRAGEVQKLLEIFCDVGIVQRFEAAYRSVTRFQNGAQTKSSAAGDVRTFIDGLKGLLFARTKNWTEENNPSWKEIAERLCRDNKNLFYKQEIEKWGDRHSVFIARLSDILKNREAGSETDLSILWTELLDRVYALLNMIDI